MGIDALFGIGFFGFFALISLVGFIFWIWALVDCLKNEPSEGNDKIIWLLVIIFLNWFGALIYAIVRRQERIRQYGK